MRGRWQGAEAVEVGVVPHRQHTSIGCGGGSSPNVQIDFCLVFCDPAVRQPLPLPTTGYDRYNFRVIDDWYGHPRSTMPFATSLQSCPLSTSAGNNNALARKLAAMR